MAMAMHEEYYSFANRTQWQASRLDFFKAGWEAAMKEMTSTNPGVEDGPIFKGTMQGVANYLERLDRNAFATLRRAYEADGWTTKTAQRYAIEYLQIEWCNIGDAWRIAQKLVD